MKVSDTLYTLTYEIYNSGEAAELSDDENIRNVLAYVEDWVVERVGDQPLTRDLVERVVAEAMFAQFNYDARNEPGLEWLLTSEEYHLVQESRRAAVAEPPPESSAAQ